MPRLAGRPGVEGRRAAPRSAGRAEDVGDLFRGPRCDLGPRSREDRAQLPRHVLGPAQRARRRRRCQRRPHLHDDKPQGPARQGAHPPGSGRHADSARLRRRRATRRRAAPFLQGGERRRRRQLHRERAGGRRRPARHDGDAPGALCAAPDKQAGRGDSRHPPGRERPSRRRRWRLRHVVVGMWACRARSILTAVADMTRLTD
mmetsp:Transcript_7714/g.20262  ORF Transcript_7714/g.20262 Transcript_7714/m.20262 type:complete len:203 (+) Transcript_7714:861-1469(+)